MPFRVIKRLSLDEGNKTFGLDITKMLSQDMNALGLDLCVSNHTITSLMNPMGSVILISRIREAFFRMPSSVVRK